MAVFPALPLFTDAVTADCAHLTDEEFGRYMRVLILMWRSPGCRIPANPEWICKRMRVDALAYQVHMHPIMQEFCTLSEGWWTQKRLAKEYLYVQGVVDKRKKAAQKRWGIESKEETPMQVDMQSTCTPHAPTPTPTPTPTPKKDKTPTPLPDWLPAEPWKKYCKHRGAKFTQNAKDLAIKKLEKWHSQGHDITEILENSIMNGWKGLFEPKERKNEANIGTYGHRDRSSQAKHVVARAIGETIFADEIRPAGEKEDR